MTSPSWQPIGWPQNRLRHDVGAGGRHYGANRTHSNAYEAYTTRSLVQNLRHALGRRIEVNIYHVILMFFFFFFLFHLFLLRWILDQFYHACVTYCLLLHLICCVFTEKNCLFFQFVFRCLFLAANFESIIIITINRTNETKLAIPHWYNRLITSNPLGEYNCVREGRLEVIWQKFMPCTGPQTQGDFKFCRDSGAGFGYKPKCE